MAGALVVAVELEEVMVVADVAHAEVDVADAEVVANGYQEPLTLTNDP